MKLPHTLILAGLCALFSTAALAKVLTNPIEDAFHSCAHLPQIAVAGNLMHAVWNPVVRATYESAHPTTIQAGSLTLTPFTSEGGERLGSATAVFRHPVSVAGIPAHSLTATTCTEGCGWSVWTLNFGKRSESEIAKLRAWARRAPVTSDESLGSIKVGLIVDIDRETKLVCDLSN